MPEDHKNYVKWDADKLISWAQNVGPNATITIISILSSHKVEQQGYRSCMALLKLVDKYSVARVEAACKKALSYTPNPSFKSVKTILSTVQDKVTEEQPAKTSDTRLQFYSECRILWGK